MILYSLLLKSIILKLAILGATCFILCIFGIVLSLAGEGLGLGDAEIELLVDELGEGLSEALSELEGLWLREYDELGL